jgi:hypothetical protein
VEPWAVAVSHPPEAKTRSSAKTVVLIIEIPEHDFKR